MPTSIVSLIASATEMVAALGLVEFLTGRSHECDWPESVKSLPVCTRPRFDVSGTSREIDQLVRSTRREAISVYEVFDAVLERLQPTHILTQIQCDVCAVSLADVERSIAASLPSRPRIVSLNPNSLDEIWADIRRVANALDVPERGDALVSDLQRRMAEVPPVPKPVRVACLEWLEPVMYSSHWMPEVLRMAGGIPVTLEEDPEVVIAAPCGFDLERTRSELYWLHGKLPKTARVYPADGNRYFNRPGPSVVETLQIVAGMLRGR